MRLVNNLLIIGLGLIVLTFAVSFTASNGSIVSLSLWPFETAFSMPIWLVGLGGFGFGLVFGGTAMSLPLMISRWQQNRLNRKLQVIEKQEDRETQKKQHAAKQDDTVPLLPKS